ncbi:hypothetical protein C8Q77DRAFT_294191 [Trametes polyzona]|nr:hypothetical protein C8Q77DRAFT_294191 [Trametes polyzona]
MAGTVAASSLNNKCARSRTPARRMRTQRSTTLKTASPTRRRPPPSGFPGRPDVRPYTYLSRNTHYHHMGAGAAMPKTEWMSVRPRPCRRIIHRKFLPSVPRAALLNASPLPASRQRPMPKACSVLARTIVTYMCTSYVYDPAARRAPPELSYSALPAVPRVSRCGAARHDATGLYCTLLIRPQSPVHRDSRPPSLDPLVDDPRPQSPNGPRRTLPVAQLTI